MDRPHAPCPKKFRQACYIKLACRTHFLITIFKPFQSKQMMRNNFIFPVIIIWCALTHFTKQGYVKEIFRNSFINAAEEIQLWRSGSMNDYFVLTDEIGNL